MELRVPHVVPVAFGYNPDADAIDIGGHDFAKRKKFRDVMRTGVAALVVDDVLPPWQPRAVEVRGEAITLETGGKAIMETFDDPIIRITPRRIVSWGLEVGFQARSVVEARRPREAPRRFAVWRRGRQPADMPSTDPDLQTIALPPREAAVKLARQRCGT